MAIYKLKRKSFAFNLTKQAFQGAKSAFKSGNIGTGLKQTGTMLGRGALGIGKIAGGAALGAAALGTAGAISFDNTTNK